MDLIKFLTCLINDDNTNYTCYALNTTNSKYTALQISFKDDELKNYMRKSIGYLTSNVYSKMSLDEYPQANPKDFIERLSNTSELVNCHINSIHSHIISPETNAKKLSSYNAYMIVATDKNSKKFIFINKQKLFKTYRNQFLFKLESKDYTPLDGNIIGLKIHFDCIISPENCYFITLQGHSIFNIRESAENATNANIEKLTHDNIIGQENCEIFNKYIQKSAHNKKSLADVNENIIDELHNATLENKDFLEKKYRLELKVNQDGQVSVDLSDENKINNFILTITNMRAIDFNNNIVVSNSPLKPSL